MILSKCDKGIEYSVSPWIISYTGKGNLNFCSRNDSEVHQSPALDTAARRADANHLGVLPDPKIGNTWVSYIRVADVSDTVQRARALGGAILLEPTHDVRDGSVAIIADPHGAGFVVQEIHE